MTLTFNTKVAQVQQANGSDVVLLFAPRIEKMPLPMQRYDDPFLPFAKTIIDATRDAVCGYVFDLAAYLTLGAAGAIALERTINYAGQEVVTVLHGPFASPAYTRLMDETAFGVDAVTITDSQYLDSFLARPDRGAFLVSYKSAKVLDAPSLGGIYWFADRLFTLSGSEGQTLWLRLAGESILYAGRGEDFAEVVRREIEKIRDE